MLNALRRCWKGSRSFRILLTIALIFTVLRLAVQVAYLGILLFPECTLFGGTPDWAGGGESTVPIDLQIYMNAAERFRNREGLYQQGSLAVHEEQYPYTPLYAFMSGILLWFSPPLTAVIDTLLHILAYGILYVTWGRIFRSLNLDSASRTLARVLPVWLVFTAFWSDLGYLNIYLIMALLATLLIGSILHERLVPAALLLAVILQIKPHWSFAAAVPLLLGRRRFFLKLVISAVAMYVVAVIGLMIVVEPAYVQAQYLEYFRFLARLGHDFPWRGPEAPFLGYNHSIKQILIYLLGPGTGTMQAATLIKLVLLAPLGWIGIRNVLNPVERAGRQVPRLALDFAFALYLGAFVWLDVVWEVSLGIVVFTYLLATTERQAVRSILWLLFLPYAWVDAWQALSLLIWGMEVIAPGPYVLTDPSLYVPVIMAVILGFYAVLIVRLGSEARIARTTKIERPMASQTHTL